MLMDFSSRGVDAKEEVNVEDDEMRTSQWVDLPVPGVPVIKMLGILR